MIMDVVEERHPLKQGLKLIHPIYLNPYTSVEERHPLKQGLKQKQIQTIKSNSCR